MEATRTHSPLTTETLFALNYMTNRNLGCLRDDNAQRWVFPQDLRDDATLAPRLIAQYAEMSKAWGAR